MKESNNIKEHRTEGDKSEEEIQSRALEIHSQRKTEEAKKYYKFLLDKGWYDPRFFSNYGSIFKQEGKIKQAIELYKTSAKLYPTNPKANYNLGTILKDIGRFKEAGFYIKKAIQLKPNFAQAHFNLG